MRKALLIVGIIFSSVIGLSQEKSSKKDWSFLVEPYLMFPNMKGQTGVGSLPDVSVDANPGDIFSNLQIGAMLYAEASTDKWSVSADFIYMKLKQDVKSSTLINNGEVTANQFAMEIAGLRRITPWFEAGIGGLMNSIKSGVNINVNTPGQGISNRNRELSKTWVDPMLIVRVKSDPAKKFLYQVRGEIGGFGIGSDFAWQLQLYAGYRFSKLFQLTGGYRVIGLDYSKGSGNDRFLYDMDTFGPVIRLGFNF